MRVPVNFRQIGIFLCLAVPLTGCAPILSTPSYDNIESLLLTLQQPTQTPAPAASEKQPKQASPEKTSTVASSDETPNAMLAFGIEPLNLSQVVAQAVTTNPEVMASLQTFQAAVEGQNIVRGNLRPEVNVQTQGGYEWRANVPGSPPENWGRYGYNLELRQLLYDGNTTASTIRQLGFEKLSAYYDLLASTDNIARETVEAYLDVLRFRHMIDIAQENYALHQRTLRLLQERQDSGVGRAVDTEQAAARLALAQTNLMTEQNNLNDVTQRYRRIVGNFPPSDLQDLADLPSPVLKDQSDFRMALQANPSVLSKQALAQAAQSGLDAAKGGFSPTFELRASSGTDRDQPTAENVGTFSNRVQVIMNYNLYRGGADSARLKQSSALLYSARNVRDYTCRNVQQELSTTWNNIEKLKAQMPFLKEHERAMSRVSRGAEEQFQIGERSLLDLLDTANELFDSRRARINGEYDMKLLEYQWVSYAHRLLPTLGLARQAPVRAPQENQALILPDDVINACLTPVPDTSNLRPAGVVYGKGVEPPTLTSIPQPPAGPGPGAPSLADKEKP